MSISVTVAGNPKTSVSVKTNPIQTKMGVQATVGTSLKTNPVGVSVSCKPYISASVQKIQVPFIKLEQLIDVDATGLQNGYTIVYDSTTQMWNVQLLPSSGPIDGGSY